MIMPDGSLFFLHVKYAKKTKDTNEDNTSSSSSSSSSATSSSKVLVYSDAYSRTELGARLRSVRGVAARELGVKARDVGVVGRDVGGVETRGDGALFRRDAKP